MTHRSVDPGKSLGALGAFGQSTIVRGDWRSRLDKVQPFDVAPTARVRLLTELSRIGLIAEVALDRYQAPFVNSELSSDYQGYFEKSKVEQERIDSLVAKRTGVLDRRIITDIAAAKTRLSSYDSVSQEAKNTGHEVQELDLDSKDTNSIELESTLQGAWRWEVSGTPIWRSNPK